MSSTRRPIGLALLLCAAALPAVSPAADLYWDPNGATAGTGGTGNWNTSSSFWRSGSDTGTLVTWTNGDIAYLGGTYGTLTTTAAITVNGIRVDSTATGTAPYTITNGTGGSFGFTGTNITLDVASGKSLRFNQSGTSGGGAAGISGTGTVTVQGGGTVTMAGSNRVYGGVMVSSGTGTALVFSSTNGLDNGSSSTGLTAQANGIIRVTATNNFRRTVTLGATGQGGGRLELGHNSAFARQSGFAINVIGNSRSTIATTSGTTFGIGGGNASYNVTVASTGDAEGIDLDYLAAWRSGTMNKAGAGTMRLGSGFTINRVGDATTYLTNFDSALTTLTVSAGTFLNEGTVKSITNVNGGTLKTASASGSFDQVNVTSGTFEISRSSTLFTTGLTFASGNNSLNLRGGTLRYVGVNTDYSSVMGDLTGTSTINTNSQDVTFATGLTGTGGFTKTGNGTLTLAGTSTYAGATSVNTGTLALASGSSLSSSGISVAAGATLSGSSSAGAVTLANGAFLEAGISGSGRLTATSVSVVDAAIANFQLRSAGATGLAAYDIVSSSLPGLDLGTLTLGTGSSVKLLVVGTAGTISSGTYAFLTLSNSPLPDLSSFAAPDWSDAGSALGRRQTAELAYAGNVLQMTVDGTYPIWTGASDLGWSTAGNWKLASNGSATDFLANDAVVFDDTGAAGTVTFSAAVAPASVTVTANTNAYTFAADGSGSITGGSLVKSGTSDLTLTGAHGFSGVTLSAGRLRVGSSSSLGSGTLVLAGGSVSGAGADAVSLANAITLSGAVTLGDATDNGDLTLSGIVSGSGSLSKVGSGQLTLSAANTFSGAVTVSDGMLKLGNAAALGTSAAGTSVLAGATVDLAGFRAVNEVYTIAGSGTSGQGAIINTGAELFGGGIDHLVLSDDATVGGSVRFDIRTGAKTLDLAGHQLTKRGTMYMALVNGATVTDGDIRIEEGSLGFETGAVVQGTGTVTAVTGGTLAITWGAQAANITRDIVMAGGGILTAGANSGANSAITLQADTPVSVASGFTLTLGGAISGDYGLTKNSAGALQLNGANSFTGPVLVNAGAVRVGSSGALGSASGITLAADSTAQLILGAADLSFDRALSIGGGSGGVAGQGALHLSASTGTSTWSGPITVLADITSGAHFGTGGATLVLSGAISAGAGVPVEFRNGTSVLSGTGSNYPILFLHSDATVRMGAADILPAGVAIQMGTSGNATIVDLNGFSQTASSVSNATAAFTNTASGIRNNNTSQSATLTLTGSTLGGVANTVISNTATATGVLSLSPGAGASLGVVLDAGDQIPVINVDTLRPTGNFSGAAAVLISANLSSANGFAKTGAGNLQLQADNTTGLLGTSDIQGGALVSSATGALGSGIIRFSDASIGAAAPLLYLQTVAQTQSNDFDVAVSGEIRTVNVASTLNSDFTLAEGVSLKFYGGGGNNNRFAITGNTSLASGATAANITFQTDSAQTHTYTGSMNLGAGTLTKSSTARLDMAGSLVAGTIAASNGAFNLASAVTAGGADGSLSLTGNSNSNFSGGITATTVTKTGTGQVSISAASDIDAFALVAGTLVVASGTDFLGTSVALSLGGETTAGKLVLGSAGAAANQTLSSLVFSGLGGSIVGGNGSADSILTLNLASNLSLGAFLGGAGTNENRIGLAKSGAGTLTLTAAGTFTGGVAVSGGTLAFTDLSALGTGTVTVNTGGTLDLGGFNLANTVVLAGGVLANDGNWTGDINISGDVTAESINSISRSTVTIISGNIDISGVTKNLVVQGGNLTGFSGYSGNLTVAGPLTLGSDPLGTITVVAGGTLDLDGRATSKGITYSGGSLTNAASYTGDVTLALSAPTTLNTGTFGGGRVAVGNGQSVTLGSGYVGDVLLTGNGSLLGPSLIGYTGQVTLGNGASLSLTDAAQGGFLNNRNATFLLQSGSTLRGQGRVGDVVVLAGGILAPGNSPGLLELGNTVLNGGGGLAMEIWQASDPVDPDFPGVAGLGYDSVDVAGELDLSTLSASSRYLIDIISLTGDGTQQGNADIFDSAAEYSFTLFTYDTLDLGANTVLGTDLSSLFLIDTSDFTDTQGEAVAANLFRVMLDAPNNSIVLTYSAIPEPSTYGLAFGLLALASVAVRRRRLCRRQGSQGPSGPGAQK